MDWLQKNTDAIKETGIGRLNGIAVVHQKIATDTYWEAVGVNVPGTKMYVVLPLNKRALSFALSTQGRKPGLKTDMEINGFQEPNWKYMLKGFSVDDVSKGLDSIIATIRDHGQCIEKSQEYWRAQRSNV